MAIINVPVDDLVELVERPVIYSVIRQLEDYTGISSKTQIRFYGQNAAAPQWNSTLSQDDRLHNLWPVVDALTIEVEEDFNTDRVLNMVVKYPDVPYIFLDSDLGVYIKPAYSTQDVTIRVKYKAKDKNQANKWRDEIRTRVAMNRKNLMHSITYSWHLPDYYVGLLKEIHSLRENIAGYGDTFDQYFHSKSSNRLKVLSNQSGSSSIYAIAESQGRIIGAFDFEGFPDKSEKDGENDNFTISFSYKFRYEKPINTVCSYPFFVHQQYVSDKYLNLDSGYDPVQLLKTLTNTGKAFEKFEGDYQLYLSMADNGVAIPYYDNFVPASIPLFTLRALTVLLSISDGDKRSLFNLGELGDFSFNSDVLEFMKTEAPYMTKFMGSIFYCQLYENEFVQDDSMLSIDSNLNIVATSDLDLRKNYHVRLGLVADLSMVNHDGISRLRANKTAMAAILKAINASLRNSGNQEGLYKNKLSLNELRVLGLTNNEVIPLGKSMVQYLYLVVDNLSNYTPQDSQTSTDLIQTTATTQTFNNIGNGSL